VFVIAFFSASAFSIFESFKIGFAGNARTWPEIIRPVVASNHPCQFEAVNGIPVVAVDTSTTESWFRPFFLVRKTL
jgi:hypothetical protein